MENLQFAAKNWLQVSYYDTIDEKWKKFHISMDEVCTDNEDLWKYELDNAIQDILYEIDKLNPRGQINNAIT